MSAPVGCGRVLIIDDERPVLLTTEALLKRRGYDVATSSSGVSGLEAVRKWRPDLVLLDLGLPDASGMDVLRTLRQDAPKVEVLILTANDTLANAIESIKLGAFHFVGKPYSAEELLNLVAQALEHRRLQAAASELREQSARLEKRLLEAEAQLSPVFHSASMRQIDELVQRVAPTDANVLLVGESGVGKEVFANRVHELSRRKGVPMVKLNCAAFPANMIEGELFGYVKGAFTGAVSDFPGMIKQANGGTLFLDEVAEMPAELQTRFLRVLQEREYRPLGSTKTLKADFRLIAATNRVIREALASGALRQDFYYRLNTFQITLPPLRDRKEEIPALVQRFCSRFAHAQGIPTPVLEPEALDVISRYPWPGNVRELQNAIQYAVILAPEGRIGLAHLPLEVRVPAGVYEALAGSEHAFSLEEAEKRSILQALVATHWNKKKAAERLGIQRATLYSKLAKYKISND
ncbi:MAG: sigma-54 dependent transcriptional regulator [Verrucomicrobiota bacterium]